MRPFETIISPAAFLPEENIDTDLIFPARYLLLMDREGLGQYLFRDRRFARDGAPNPGFVFNDPRFAEARVLVAGAGFGCGSSREQAVWALSDFGIGCVIAPSFGEIFAANALKNGLLPLVLLANQVRDLGLQATSGAIFEVNLADGFLAVGGTRVAPIVLPESQRQALLKGWDETDILLNEESDAIAAFEAAHRAAQPWLFSETRL